MQIRAQPAGSGTDLILWGLYRQRDNGNLIAILAFQFAEPFEGGPAGRAPGSPELDEHNAAAELLDGEWMA